MIDYEYLILLRQDLQEILEDDPDGVQAHLGLTSEEIDNWWDEIPTEDFTEVKR